jgi:Protein of unknown function (DUF2786)
MDKERLTKLMRMTTSPNDGEALNALRKANELLKAAKMDWQQVLNSAASSGMPQPYKPFSGPAPATNPLGMSPNKFPAQCYCCGDDVSIGEGVIFKPIRFNSIATSKWCVACADCNRTAKVKPKSYMEGLS